MNGAKPSTSKESQRKSYKDKRPLTDEIVEELTFENIPDEKKNDTDIQSDFDKNEDAIYDQLEKDLTAVQRNKILNTNKDQLMVFIGSNMPMGYHKVPNWRHYWSTSTDLGVLLESSAMSRGRFDLILSNFHVNDNGKMPNDNKDKLYKLQYSVTSTSMITGKCRMITKISFINYVQ
ncbi:Transposase IS4 [Popillia japonica]|uniref:Transposase IS4 n=1 Tax=Popillia japonica TaxID=7064 RepID=A0AAW1KL22_POPJA